jgi:acyl-coenzyme A synthetase/AMP-(fatty) acid ligase
MNPDTIVEPTQTILGYFETVREAHPDAVAFEEVHPAPDALPAGKGTDAITFAALDERSTRIANGLRAVGVDAGDIVAYQLPNWVEFPLLNLALLKLGAVSTPILPEHRAYEVGFMVDLCGSDVVVAPAEFRGFDYVDMLEGLIDDGEIDPSHVFVVGEFESEDDRFEPFSALESGPAEPVDSPLELDSLEQLVFTSGTTGEPKGVRQTARTGLYQITTPNAEILELDASDVIFAPSPLAHNTGYQYFMRMGMYTGASVVLFDKWVPDAALETIAEHECTFCAGATTFLKDLLDRPEVDEYDLPSLDLFFLAGSPIPEPVVREAYEQFDNLTLSRVWGQTENGMVTATRRDDTLERIARTDGRALSHADVTVRDEYEGSEVRNERGKLLMRGKPLTDGYYRRPEITAESFTDDGWFKTGDIAVMDEDGYITIEGREKDIIIRGGENISAPEVEEHVLDHPLVREVAVVAMPDERLQERPCAYVSLVPDADPSELTVDALSAFLDERGLQKHKHPERIEFVDAFPRTSTGKIQKFELREEIGELVESE